MLFDTMLPVGLSSDAVASRAAREAKSATSVRERLMPAHRTLDAIRCWLATDHDLYSSTGLAQRAVASSGEGEGSKGSAALLESYGGKAKSNSSSASAENNNHPLSGGLNLLALVGAATVGAAAAAALLLAKPRRGQYNTG